VARFFYVKDISTKPRNRKNKPKPHIVLSGKKIMGVADKTYMCEDYNKFDEISPFTVNTDRSIPLNKMFHVYSAEEYSNTWIAFTLSL
jgi:hypothetical protein